MQAFHDASPDHHPRSRVAYADFHLQLPEEFLLMTDRFSMAHSLEARTPFLDKELIDTVFSIPPEIRTTQASLKGLFIEAVADLLPTEILGKKKKGFVLPMAQWLRGRLRPLVTELFDREYLKQQGIFSNEIIPRYVRPHMDGQRDCSWQVWTLLGFQMWYEKEIRGNSLRV
jgi:asparagine synthase (glutamine-hydrolysing)